MIVKGYSRVNNLACLLDGFLWIFMAPFVEAVHTAIGCYSDPFVTLSVEKSKLTGAKFGFQRLILGPLLIFLSLTLLPFTICSFLIWTLINIGKYRRLENTIQ